MRKSFPTRFLWSVLAALGLSNGCARSTPQQAFWSWFQANEDELFNFEKDQEQTFDRLEAQMHKVDSHVTFEFGPKENGRREFTISADGIKAAFPSVEALYVTAPSLPRWKFSKFRQRHEPTNISFNGIAMQWNRVAVELQPVGNKVDVIVFLQGYSQTPNQTYESIAFLFLDQALGEYDVETRVGEVQVKPLTAVSANAYSLEKLPKAFDELFAGK